MTPPTRLRHLLLPLCTGAAALALTGWLWHHEQQGLDATLRADFDVSVRQTAGRIEQRVATYEQMLRATRGLFDASEDVSQEDFRQFVDALTGGTELAGLQAMLFTPRLNGAQVARHVATRRALGDPGYRIQPPGKRDILGPVTYVAPASPDNLKALGHDILTDPARRDAMLQARDSGGIAITPRINLLMDRPAIRPAFAMYLAIYARGRPIDTLAARQAHLNGWVHIAFRLHDLMASLYGEDTPGIALRIYDGVRTDAASLIFDSHPGDDPAPPRFKATEYISFPQSHWTLQIRSIPAFELRRDRGSATIIAIAGTCVSLLLALLMHQLVTGRARAYAHALTMTRELRESEERMRHMAQHDALTLLPNRALLADRLHAALALARRDKTRSGLMFVDLDHFKPVNDIHGHAIGDRLLLAATARMRDCLRESDTLARMGGDEFVVLLPHIDSQADAQLVAERIRSAIALPFTIDQHNLQISTSIGIGIYPDDASTPESLTICADDAMYRAKDAGRNRLVFASET